MPDDVHLFLLIHGLWGKPTHLDVARDELERAWWGAHPPNVDCFPPTREELVIVVAECMKANLTYDGVDVCASRVAWEVDQHVARLEEAGRRVTKFSVMGYSLGGLVARYLVGLLHTRTPSFFDQHTPVSFSTIATPHLGIPRYNTFLSSALSWLGGRLMSRTGEQLYVCDTYSEGDPRPLLEIMADPKKVFHQGLSRFANMTIYASIVNDSTVPFPSAAIATTDPFVQWIDRGLEVEASENGIVSDWHFPVLDRKPKKQWGYHLGTLPPIFRFRWPFNYVILALFPILFPILFLLVLARFSLDTARSRKRLQRLARVGDPTAPASPASPVSPIPSHHGLSIDGLRAAIRAVERNIEQDLIEAAEYDIGQEQDEDSVLYETKFDHEHDCSYECDNLEHHTSHLDTPHDKNGSCNGTGIGKGLKQMQSKDAPLFYPEPTIHVRMMDTQLRMIHWLNALDPIKHLAWFPDVPNSHAVVIVRDPLRFPIHERGRGMVRHWANAVVEAVMAH